MGIVGVTGQVLEFHRSGKMRVLAVTSSTRLTAAPELPTTAVLGLPRHDRDGAPLGCSHRPGPRMEIIEQIAQATRMAVAEPTYHNRC